MTNRFFILLLLSSLFTVVVNGQNKKFEPEWNIGVGFGPTLSSVSFDPNRALNYGGTISTKNLQQYAGDLLYAISPKRIWGL